MGDRETYSPCYQFRPDFTMNYEEEVISEMELDFARRGIKYRETDAYKKSKELDIGLYKMRVELNNARKEQEINQIKEQLKKIRKGNDQKDSAKKRKLKQENP